MRAARATVADWNIKNPEQKMQTLAPDVKRRVRELQKSKDHRIADTAPRAMLTNREKTRQGPAPNERCEDTAYQRPESTNPAPSARRTWRRLPNRPPLHWCQRG